MTHNALKLVKKKHKVFSKYNRPDHSACTEIVRKVKRELKTSRLNFEQKLALKLKEDKSFFLCV